MPGRHHGKAAALFAGPRCFDGGIEGEQIGLVGDLADNGGDVADLLDVLG